MVVMVLVIIFIIIFVVMWFYILVCDILFYKRWSIGFDDDKDELCMFFCFVGEWNIFGMVNIIEIIRGKYYKFL